MGRDGGAAVRDGGAAGCGGCNGRGEVRWGGRDQGAPSPALLGSQPAPAPGSELGKGLGSMGEREDDMTADLLEMPSQRRASSAPAAGINASVISSCCLI